MTIDRRVESGRQALRLAFGIVPLLAGLDKFFNLLTDWPRYLSPAAQAILPVSAATLMTVADAVEMLDGIAMITSWTEMRGDNADGELAAHALHLASARAGLLRAARQ